MFLSEMDSLYALDAATGTKKWEFAKGWSVLAARLGHKLVIWPCLARESHQLDKNLPTPIQIMLGHLP